MNTAENIRSIILEVNKADLSERETHDIMDRMLALDKWEEIRAGLLDILYENDQSLWHETVLYIYYFQGRGYKYEETKTIALLYSCLILSDELDDNLIWTITKDIKGVSYLSGYDPFRDQTVVEEMEKIKKMRRQP